jgi:uncharacterized cupin superfamily protein
MGEAWLGEIILTSELLKTGHFALFEWTAGKATQLPSSLTITTIANQNPTINTLTWFTLDILPTTGTVPATITWQTDNQTIQEYIQDTTITQALWWDTPGQKTIMVTFENYVGVATTTYTLTVEAPQPVTLEPGVGGIIPGTSCDLVCIQIPGGAISETTEFHYTPIVNYTIPTTGTGSLGSGNLNIFSDFVGVAFQLEAFQDGNLVTGFTFAEPVTVTIHYNNLMLNQFNLNTSTLNLRYWNGESWVTDGITLIDIITTNDGIDIVVEITHLSEFALFGEQKVATTIYLPLILK